ncbi:MAG: hypothetical protein L0H64_22265 [Pseudonocardia sp.]|nr:hypothetical protein [Pseudonocardia sp.]
MPLLIETHGKQAYIFGTGKRREAVGASYLVHAVTDWARAALPPSAEVLVATSGTVLAFVDEHADAVAAVRAVTTRALSDAPGLGVTGVVGEPIEWESGHAPAAVATLFARMAQVRVSRPGPTSRFPVLPVTALCPSSALPVAGLTHAGEERSASSLAKLAAAPDALARLSSLTGLTVAHLGAATERLAGDLDDSPARVAVVHADGNGLGKLVARLADVLVPPGATDPDTRYVQGYRAFSDALASVAEQAFRAAVDDLPVAEPDVLPLVLGGDDITFVVDATYAPQLTRTFLHALVAIAADTQAIAGPVAAASSTGDPRLGIAAGMVVTTPHFPFSAAYGMAEDLLTDVAKQAKSAVVDPAGDPVPCVSVAAYVQIDSSAAATGARLGALTSGDRLLTGGPFVAAVTERELSVDAATWLHARDLDDDLVALARSLHAVDDEGRRIRPSAQLHELRRRLRPDPRAADEYLGRLLAADPERWAMLQEDPGSLFTRRSSGPPTTRFLDALTLAPYTAGM